MIFQRLEEGSQNRKPWWAAVAAGSSLFCVFVLLVINPLQTEIETLQVDLSGLNQQLMTAKEKVATLASLQARVDTMRENIEQQVHHIARFQDLQEFRQVVTKEARRAGARVVSWKPHPAAPWSAFFRAVPVTLRIEGRYHQVALFLEALCEDGGIHHVESFIMRVSDDDADENRLQTEIRLVGILASGSGEPAPQLARQAADSSVMTGS